MNYNNSVIKASTALLQLMIVIYEGVVIKEKNATVLCLYIAALKINGPLQAHTPSRRVQH